MEPSPGDSGIAREVVVFKGTFDPAFCHAIAISGDTESDVGSSGTVRRLFLLPGFTLTLYRLGFNASWQLRSSIWTKEENRSQRSQGLWTNTSTQSPEGRTRGRQTCDDQRWQAELVQRI